MILNSDYENCFQKDLILGFLKSIFRGFEIEIQLPSYFAHHCPQDKTYYITYDFIIILYCITYDTGIGRLVSYINMLHCVR